ncbi:glycosyltransferase [Bacillales bacterium AN1005]|uniref:glycosyltransferase n=1 Tax=Niallia taxi TaxID=2499688 RepID=UPI0021A88708|nr:glycosyltransferase [Niallia taxi]MCT2347465.1 glycosyltransferase [Niallia taxi]
MKKKVAMVLPNYKGGGMPKVCETISLNLRPEEYEQTLIILSSEKEKRYKFAGKSINISPSGNSLISKLLINFTRIGKLKKIKKEWNFDTVISFGVQANIFNIITKNKETIICTEHNIKSIENKTWGFKGKIYDFLMRKYYNNSDQLVAISEVMKVDLEDNYGIKDIEVIYNPHNIEEVKRKSNESIDDRYKELFLDGPVLISVGRLAYAKAQWSMIRVMEKIILKFPTAKLLILGEGELKNELQELVRTLGLEENIRFLGHVDNPYNLIKQADIFVLSSLFEGFPNVLIEALASGTAIVSTDCPSGPREILDNKININKSIEKFEICDYGILTPCLPNKMYKKEELNIQEVELLKAVEYLLENPETKESFEKKGNIYAQHYDASNIIKKYIELF